LKKHFDQRQRDLDAKQNQLQKEREDIEKQREVLSKDALANRVEKWQAPPFLNVKSCVPR
jgi:hypothetical protein